MNDAFRQILNSGRVVMSAALPEDVRDIVLLRVATFDTFNTGNDPYQEHDFGIIEVEGVRCCWKIDYFDCSLRLHSPDPANPVVSGRVLTIMLAEEF